MIELPLDCRDAREIRIISMKFLSFILCDESGAHIGIFSDGVPSSEPGDRNHLTFTSAPISTKKLKAAHATLGDSVFGVLKRPWGAKIFTVAWGLSGGRSFAPAWLAGGEIVIG